ncbi:MAG: hypothetical protein BWY31_01411 [Lentisphaerae bacterium ADurb.Bin242]|nr:MAG: hypothetical protein BWY31_01411 [Lentisphaerae bacterium ADurb.Bin242]
MNCYGRKLKSFRANLHTHSTTSDGSFPPEEVIRRYAGAAYDVLAFTDHWKTNPVSSYDPHGMTLLSGVELHPPGPRGIRWHILGVGLPEDFAYPELQSGQAAVDAVNAAGGIAFCAHPYWCGFTSADVMSLKNILGIEVYNTSTRYIGKEYNMQCWDELLNAGKKYTALAVDDVHSERDLFRGFTVILAENKKPETLLRALRNGDFYASQGPLFKKIAFANGILEAEFTPVTSAIVVSNGPSGYCETVANFGGESYGEPEKTSLRRDFSDKKSGYLRIQLKDVSGKMAWSNPIWLG